VSDDGSDLIGRSFHHDQSDIYVTFIARCSPNELGKPRIIVVWSDIGDYAPADVGQMRKWIRNREMVEL
jgi:hypothetical protein